jgi:hypothetical protein
MGNCPFHGDDGEPTRESASRTHGWGTEPAVGRRSVVKSAVAIGGLGALSTVLRVTADSGDDPSAMPFPQGDPSNRPAQQHRWSDAGRSDRFGNPVAPAHQVVLLLDYVGDDIADDRATVEASFRQLEEAFAYDQREGLLFNVGYSPRYFKRHSRGTPTDVDITEPRAVSPHNDPEFDRQDVFVQLASDEAAIVLAAEEALLGTVDEVNGVAVDASLDGCCAVDERRSIFAGPGLPNDRITDEDAGEHIDEEAPLSMGFASVYADSIPPEERITITDGPWADGTVAMVSKLRLELEAWYEDLTEAERVEQMFAPQYTTADVGDVGEGLGEGSGRGDGEGWERALTERTETDAREKGVVGHAQKVSRARDDDFDVDLLRRDGDITVAGGKGGLSFVGLVEGISDWFEMGELMYDPGLDGTLRGHDGGADDGCSRGHGDDEDDEGDGRGPDDASTGHHPRSGIAAQIDVLRRGHFLFPPRSLRALPPSRP